MHLLAPTDRDRAQPNMRLLVLLVATLALCQGKKLGIWEKCGDAIEGGEKIEDKCGDRLRCCKFEGTLKCVPENTPCDKEKKEKVGPKIEDARYGQPCAGKKCYPGFVCCLEKGRAGSTRVCTKAKDCRKKIEDARYGEPCAGKKCYPGFVCCLEKGRDGDTRVCTKPKDCRKKIEGELCSKTKSQCAAGLQCCYPKDQTGERCAKAELCKKEGEGGSKELDAECKTNAECKQRLNCCQIDESLKFMCAKDGYCLSGGAIRAYKKKSLQNKLKPKEE